MRKNISISHKILFIFFISICLFFILNLYIVLNISDNYKQIIIKLDASKKNIINKIQILYIYLLVIVSVFSILLLSIILTYIVKRNLIIPINQLVNLTGQIAKGNLNIVSNLKVKNELSILSDNFNSMIRGINSYQSDIIKKEQEIIKLNKIDFISKLSTGLSHELKHPVQNLKLLVEDLRNRLDDTQIKEISDEINKISRIINSISEFSKLKNVQVEKLFLFKELQSIINQINCPDEIKININIKSDVSFLFNKFLFETLIKNIIYNSINVMATGNINIYTESANDFVVIAIADEGFGINEQEKEIIFEPFVSLSQKKGTGLGLTLCREIINYFDGKITVENRQDRTGAIVKLYIKPEKIINS